MSYHLGVDLGTTFTAAARAHGGRAEPVTLGSRSMAVPSVVHLSGDDLLVGEVAVRRATTEPGRVAREFKRRVGDPTPLLLGGTPIAAERLMARLLAWVVAQVSSTEGEAPQSLAVTHPANWGEYKLDLLRQAIRHVDLTVDHFVPEPVAAASFYASERNLAPGSLVAVYDLGGGTFDAAMVAVDEHGFRIVGRPDGIERLGGIDFDHAVFAHVLQALDLDPDQLDPGDAATTSALVRLRHDCVEAKEALSAETEVSIPVMLPNRHTEVRLTRYEFESMIRPALGETLTALQRAVASAEAPVEAVSAVLLVGGSSRIPLVAQLVTAELGRPVAMDARPKEAIPLGAALLADRAAHAAPPAPVIPPVPAQPTQPHPPPAMGTGLPPSGDGKPGNRARTLWVVLGAAAIVAALVAATQLGGGGDGDDGTTTTTEQAGSTETTDTTDDGSTTTSSGSTEGGMEPLPGDDWGPEARAAFVPGCAESAMATGFPLGDIETEDTCGCLYDEMVEAGVDFDEFNEAWSGTDVPRDHPGVQALESATFACITEAAA